jgi:hypothetical protein
VHGLKVVAVAVVAQAVWGMARNLCPDAPRITIMAAATCFVLLMPTAMGAGGHRDCGDHRPGAVQTHCKTLRMIPCRL